MHTPRVDPKLRRALWWSLAGPTLRDSLSVMLLAAAALAMAVGVYWNLFRNQADVRGAAPIQAEGVVTSIAYRPVNETNANPHRLALIMVDGKTLLPNPDTGGMFHTLNPPLRQGQRVRYTYRIGKSGRCRFPLARSPLAFLLALLASWRFKPSGRHPHILGKVPL